MTHKALNSYFDSVYNVEAIIVGCLIWHCPLHLSQ